MFMTKKIIRHSLSIILLSMCLTLVPATVDFTEFNQAKAATWWDTANTGGLNEVGKTAYGSTNTPTDIRIIVARIIRVVLGLLGIIALVIIIYAGFKWMTAGGEEEKITTAKNQLTNGVIGLIIILAAYSVATFVFYQLQYALTGVMPVTWY